MGQEFKYTDEQIEHAVIAALNERLAVDAAEVDVRVKNGIVLLTGAVEERPTYEVLEEIVRSCEGVRDVDNSVTIGPNQIDKRQVAANLGRPQEAARK